MPKTNYLVIDPTDVPRVFKFIATKRDQRIGWGDEFPVFETHWPHSREEGELMWLPASEDEIKATAKSAKHVKAEDLLEIVPLIDPISKNKFLSLAKEKWKIGR